MFATSREGRSISSRGRLAQASPLQQLESLAEQREKVGVKVHHLNLGQPDLLTDRAAFKNLHLVEGTTLAYAPARGFASTLRAWSSYFHHAGIEFSDEEMVITAGASEAIVFALAAVCDPGDEVLVFEPYYTNYNGLASLAGVRLHPVPLSIRNGFHLPAASDIEKHIGVKTKAILFCNPNNPTGTVYSRKELQGLVELAMTYDLFLISDEVYREFSYETQHQSIMRFAEAHDYAILVDSTSKRFNVCGARIGVLASHNPQVMSTALKFAMARVAAATIEQSLVEEMLTAAPSFTGPLVEEFRKRRDVAYKEMKKIHGITFHKPEGAFYAVVGLPVNDSEEFARWMVEEFHYQGETVMVAPATGFYSTPGAGKGEIRLALVLNTDQLRRALLILARGIYEYQRAHAT